MFLTNFTGKRPYEGCNLLRVLHDALSISSRKSNEMISRQASLLLFFFLDDRGIEIPIILLQMHNIIIIT